MIPWHWATATIGPSVRLVQVEDTLDLIQNSLDSGLALSPKHAFSQRRLQPQTKKQKGGLIPVHSRGLDSERQVMSFLYTFLLATQERFA